MRDMLEKSACPNCGFKVNKSWSFCPNCGFSLKSQNKNFIEVDFGKMFKEIVPNIAQMVNSILQQQFSPSVDQKDDRMMQVWNHGGEIVEPIDVVSKNDNITIHSIYLPDVSSRNDIFVQKFENSIEVRAIGKNKRYLTIIQRDKDTKILSEEFKDKNLIIILQKNQK